MIAFFRGRYSVSQIPPQVPEDLATLPPEKQKMRILWRSAWMMGLGTIVVLLFSDPMVDVLAELGNRIHVPPFYVAFVLAPVASNASELIASIKYAMKKTKKTITISIGALEGAACMNNTFCLALFLLLIIAKDLVSAFFSILFLPLKYFSAFSCFSLFRFFAFPLFRFRPLFLFLLLLFTSCFIATTSFFYSSQKWEFSAETLSILFVEIIVFAFTTKRTHNLLDAILLISIYPLSLVLVGLLEGPGGLNQLLFIVFTYLMVNKLQHNARSQQLWAFYKLGQK